MELVAGGIDKDVHIAGADELGGAVFLGLVLDRALDDAAFADTVHAHVGVFDLESCVFVETDTDGIFQSADSHPDARHSVALPHMGIDGETRQEVEAGGKR